MRQKPPVEVFDAPTDVSGVSRDLSRKPGKEATRLGGRADPVSGYAGFTASGPVFEWLVIPVRPRSAFAPGTLSEPPELHFKRILAKTVICSAAQLICAAADVNPPGVLAHSVQFGT